MIRLSRRLQSIETRRSTSRSSDATRLLVEMLGRRDAMFFPFRSHGDFRPELERLKRDYLAGAIGLAAKAEGARDWKASHERRMELIAAGWATAMRGGGQITSLFLTASGEAAARAMVGRRLLTAAEAAPLLECLGACEGRQFMGRKWVSESEVFGRQLSGDPADWEHMTEAMLPLLTAGLVLSNSDVAGRLYYSPVDGVAMPEEVESDQEVDAAADGAYMDAFDAERAVLERLESTGGDLVIPIPATR